MALYNTKGTISYMSEVTRGTSNSGREWARMNVMIDIPGYAGSITKVNFNVGTDRIDDVLEFKVGDKVEIAWSIYAREYNGRWYNNVDLVTIKPQEGIQAAPAPAPAPVQQKLNMTPNTESLDPAENPDDLPW